LKGITTAVQIQAYQSDLDPNNHTPQDTYEMIDPDYLFRQIKATTAIAAHLIVPLPEKLKFHLS
jgi:hypothetical protein